MIDSLSHFERSLCLRALLHSVQTNTGDGFHNHDQCHAAYVVGEHDLDNDFGDSPEDNTLYKLLLDLSKWADEHCSDFRREELIFSWGDFCKMAVAGYQANPRREWPAKAK